MSDSYFAEAQIYIPGGVNSPVRAFKAVGTEPVFIARASGSRVFGENGRSYIDYVGSWGPMILGHAHPSVVAAVRDAAGRGTSFGAPTLLETRLARRICEILPAVEQVRMVSSGTEATMSAIRLARGFTGRDLIAKFEGCYHGHSDSLLVQAGSGALTLGVPSSPGVPESVASLTLTLRFNDADSVASAFAQHGERIACVIVEPVAGNMNMVPPVPGFLESLREHCDRHGALLIFDEVMTGFRIGLDGAQGRYGVRPDLTTLGKVIGGGTPVGAFGGRREIMQMLAPEGPVYQAGTLSGCPLAMAAGLATLEGISKPGFYPALEARTKRLTNGLRAAAAASGVALSSHCLGGMFGVFFTSVDPVHYFEQVMACDRDLFTRFFRGMLESGIYLAPSPFEAGFVSAAHSDEDIDLTLAAAERVLAGLAG